MKIIKRILDDGRIVYYQQLKALNVFVNEKIKDYLNKQIFGDDHDSFYDLMNLLIHDDSFYDYVKKVNIGYINMIFIIKINDEISDSNISDNEKIYNFESDLSESENYYNNINNGLIFSKYIIPKVNLNATNFNVLFEETKIKYVAENYKINSCFLNSILNCFKESFDKKYDNKLTYNYLIEILDLDKNRDDNFGVSINRIVDRFFKKFNLVLDVINSKDILIFSYRPDKLNTSIRPQIIRVMKHNNHIILLDDQLKSFDQIKKSKS